MAAEGRADATARTGFTERQARFLATVEQRVHKVDMQAAGATVVSALTAPDRRLHDALADAGVAARLPVHVVGDARPVDAGGPRAIEGALASAAAVTVALAASLR